MRRQSTPRRAFTLIEVLLVILILGMLATVGVVMLSGTQQGAKIDTTQIKIDKVIGQLEIYQQAVGDYPSEEQGLAALITKPEFEEEAIGKKWRGPYLSKDDLKDAWGKDLVYRVVEDEATGRKKPRIHSLGPNKNDDSGEGDDIKDKRWTGEAKDSN